jgi:hypothetical protein
MVIFVYINLSIYLSLFLSLSLYLCIRQVIGSLFFSRERCISQRNVFRQGMAHIRQLNQMQTMLFDLVPSAYAKQLIAGCTNIQATTGRAVVMHLDICNFTVLSQALDATKLAGRLFFCWTLACVCICSIL